MVLVNISRFYTTCNYISSTRNAFCASLENSAEGGMRDSEVDYNINAAVERR
jgi:hypothetical protein